MIPATAEQQNLEQRTPVNFLLVMFFPTKQYLLLDGNSMSCEDLVALGQNKYRIRLTQESRKRVQASRDVLEQIVKDNKGT